MKKTYTKPELFYEDFTLMDAIATAPCTSRVPHASSTTCAMEEGIFAEGAGTPCTEFWTEEEFLDYMGNGPFAS